METLLVEPEAILADDLKFFIEDEGHACTVCRNAGDVIEIFEQLDKFDIVITEVAIRIPPDIQWETEGLEGIGGRLGYSTLSGMFSMIWDEVASIGLPNKLANAVCKISTETWPHTFICPKYATMPEYKQYAPANHFHATQGVTPPRLEHWMDLTNVLSSMPWASRPEWIEGVDRPLPLLYNLNGGETNTKLMLAGRK